MASGDTFQAAVNLVFSCANSIFAGVHLQTMRTQYYKAIQLMEERKLVIFKVQSQYVQDPVFKLIGTDEQPSMFPPRNRLFLQRTIASGHRTFSREHMSASCIVHTMIRKKTWRSTYVASETPGPICFSRMLFKHFTLVSSPSGWLES